MNEEERSSCRVCSTQLESVLSLGKMPLVNSFLTKDEIPNEEKFDLTVGFCPSCYMVQLLETVPPEKMFRDYVYFSSTSQAFLDHCKEVAEKLTKKLALDSESLVLEVASNDGAQLQYFQKLGIPVLGVDPAENIAAEANRKGIRTLPEFFNYEFAHRLKQKEGVQADLIFGANVLAHVPTIVDFISGVKEVLKPKGTAVFEFPYLQGLLDKKFDTIYHEHVFYYSLLALQGLFARAGLEIYDVEMTPMQGGSLMIFASHRGAFSVSDRVKALTQEENRKGFDQLETYQKMGKSVKQLKAELLELLNDLQSDGKRVAAYSAPAKGNILLNYFGIEGNYLEFIVDKAEAKQGLYTPGTHLEVFPPEKIYQEDPDYLLVLCWNLADEIQEQLKDYHKGGGKFIIPVPEVKVL